MLVFNSNNVGRNTPGFCFHGGLARIKFRSDRLPNRTGRFSSFHNLQKL